MQTFDDNLFPDPLNKSQLLNTGGEANETAIRLAIIATGKFKIIGMSGS